MKQIRAAILFVLVLLLMQIFLSPALAQSSSVRMPQQVAVPANPANPGGGVEKLPHPEASRGLLRINKDGSYQYKVPLGKKSKALSVRFQTMSPPKITNTHNDLEYKNLYGSANVYGLAFDYEWQPFRGFGSLGIEMGAGLSVLKGRGVLNDGEQSASKEGFTLFMVPVNLFLVYRFEYVSRQWVVPYIKAGGSYFGMVENREDTRNLNSAGAAAVGGGGGVLVSITRMDPQATFSMNQDYGITDMWLSLEARVMKGLQRQRDFSSMTYVLGVTVDY